LVFPFLTCYYGNGGTKVSKKAEQRLSLSSTLKLDQAPVVTVTGKAFWDIGHAPKDQSNRRSHLPRLRCMGDSPGNEIGIRQ